MGELQPAVSLGDKHTAALTAGQKRNSREKARARLRNEICMQGVQTVLMLNSSSGVMSGNKNLYQPRSKGIFFQDREILSVLSQDYPAAF